MENFMAFSITRKGAKHEYDAPCQDASTHYPDESDNHPDNVAIAVVADGHGSTRCFRSDIGSKKAVEIAKNFVAKFANETSELPSEMTTQITLNNVVREIIDKWFAAVMKHEEEHSLKDDPRLEGIAEKYKDRYIDDIDYRCHAYGTTLMVAVMRENYWFCFQVGDGKCVALYDDGSWDLPIPWDDRCSFNVTTSICDDDSLSGFRYWFGFGNEDGTYTEYGYGVNGQNKDYDRKINSRPLAIFIGSDGVEDSYPRINNDKYVINFYRNRIVSLAENGFEFFKEEIAGFAERFAERESTDDVSIAVIVGDVKKADIEKMKRDSEAHEQGELTSVKRRDADEKKDALDIVQKRTSSIMASQRQLEDKIEFINRYVADLNDKKASFESSLESKKAEVGTSDREMGSLQSKLRELESERDKRVGNEQFVREKIHIAKSELKKTEKERDKCANDLANKQDLLQKRNGYYNKYFQKLSAAQSLSKTNVRPPNYVVTKDNQTFNITINMCSQTTTKQPGDPSVASSHSPNSGVIPDEKLHSLKQDIAKITKEIQDLQDQVVVAEQNAEEKGSELSSLHQRLSEAQQRTQKVKADINRLQQDYRTVEIQNQIQRANVDKLQNDIAETERNIRIKQTEVNKLNDELKIFKEQTKKQTDTLEQIRNDWKKAEDEAKSLEKIAQDNNQSGGV